MADDPNRLLRDRVNDALLGVYELTEELGEGGMAIVFLARDLKHDRDVAVKVLRPEIVSHVGCERFLKEIKTTATLVHPHILSLIDSGDASGIPYYVMPYIDGESLAARLARQKQLSVNDALKITTDVAAALDYAHRSGIVHRDVKPANILLHDGEALVADFGVALAMQAAGGQRLTGTGFAVGTPQYMSPEQAAADRELDARSDIYSLGVVLFEMLAGEPPHSGATVHAVLAKVLSERPTNLSVVRDIPQHIEAAVNTALAKEPSDRFESCGEFIAALTTPGAKRLTRRRLTAKRTLNTMGLAAFGGMAVIAVAAVLIATRDGGSSGGPDPVTRQITFSGSVRDVSVAPDGEMISYLTDDRRSLIVRDLASDQEVHVLDAPSPLGLPQWSPSGTSILVAGDVAGTYGLHLVPRLGGESHLAVGFIRGGMGEPGRPRLAAGRPEQMRQFALGGYDFAAEEGAYLVACCGGRVFLGPRGSTIRALSPDSFATEGGHFIDIDEEMLQIESLSASPDGDWYAFAGVSGDQQVIVGVSATDGSGTDFIAALGGIGSIGPAGRHGTVRWPAPGETIFFSRQLGHGTNILAVPFDNRHGASTGPPRTSRSGLPLGATFDVSLPSNRLVYAGGPRRAQLELTDLGTGQESSAPTRRITEGTWLHSSPSISPDGESVAYLKGSGLDWDIYRRPITGGTEERLTDDRSPIGSLAWSPEGSRIVYAAALEEGVALHVLDLATGQTQRVGSSQRSLEGRPQWSPDGKQLVYRSRPSDSAAQAAIGSVRGRPRLVLLDLSTASESDFAQPGFFGLAGVVFSPDGSSIAALGVGNAGERGFGLWIIPRDGGTPRRLIEGTALPLVWSRGGVIYFIRDLFGSADTRRIEMVSVSGGEPEVHAVLPASCEPADISVSLGGDKVVCTAVEVESDVWLIDFFQPGS
ncbi:MAG: protein kinase [Gemmatimonadota bacterium]|nr:MAG: protein kinase [Gemmatimonadota bacterium]